MREFINKYGYILAPIVVVLGIIVYFILRHTPSPGARAGNARYAFFIDEETGAESVLIQPQIPPLMGKSGRPTVARAVKFSCDGGRTAQVLYLFKYTDAAQAELKSLPDNDTAADFRRADLEAHGTLIRAPAAGPWVPGDSQEAETLTTPVCPEGKSALIVYPQK